MVKSLLDNDRDKVQIYQKYKDIFKTIFKGSFSSSCSVIIAQYMFQRGFREGFGSTVRTSRYGVVYVPEYLEQYMTLSYKGDVTSYDSMVYTLVRWKGTVCGIKRGKSIEISLTERTPKISFDDTILKLDGMEYYDNASADMQAIARILAYARIGAYIDTEVLNGISSWGTISNPIIIRDNVYSRNWIGLNESTIIDYMLEKHS